MTMNGKILLRKRSVIETVNDGLKNICQVEHSRHRSFINFVVNLLAGLAAYSFFPKKNRLSNLKLQNQTKLLFLKIELRPIVWVFRLLI